MRADSIVFAVAGVLFGVIVGWVLGIDSSAVNSFNVRSE